MPAAPSSSRTASPRSETVPKAGASRPRDLVVPRLPARFAAPVLAFAAVFAQQRTWRRAAPLPTGAIPAPGERTVTGPSGVAGLGREPRFTSHHRVLGRAARDARAAARPPGRR